MCSGDGVSLQTITDLVRPASEAGFVTFHSLGEIYRDSLTLEQALLPDVLVAYRMNGAELPPDHGPARAADHAAHVRLQGPEVAHPHRVP